MRRLQEKQIIRSKRRIVAFVLALLMLIQNIGSGSLTMAVRAENDGHKVTVFYGHGGAAGTSASATATRVFANGLNNKAYAGTAKQGVTNGDFSDPSGSASNVSYAQTNAPSAVKRVDVIYGDLKYTFDSYATATLYLSSDGKNLNLSSGTRILKFGGGATAWNPKSTKSVIRFYNIADDLSIVYHYADEVTLSIDAGEGASYTSDFPGYSDVDDKNVFEGYSRPRTISEGFDTSFQIPEGKTIDCIKLNIGDKTLTIPNTAVREGTYINSAYELTNDSQDAILYYKENKLTVYAIEENIALNVQYTHTITFDAETNGGALLDPAAATAVTVNGKVVSFPETADRSKEDPPMYFVGWSYEGAYVNKDTVFTSDATLVATWSGTEDMPSYTVTFKVSDELCSFADQQVYITSPFAEKPGDPGIEGYAIAGFYSDELYENEFDFSTAITQNITIYVRMEKKHVITVTGALNKGQGTPITASQFEAYVAKNGGSVDLNNGIIELVGDYSNTTGCGLGVNAAYGAVSSIVVAMGDYTWTFSGEAITSASTYTSFIGSDYKERVDKKYIAGDFFKYSHTPASTLYSLRFYEISDDITITVNYEVYETEVVDTKGYFSTIHYDYYPTDSDATVEDSLLRISSQYLRGTDDHSYRVAIMPSATAVLKGIHVSDGTGSYEKELLVAASTPAIYEEAGLGKIKIAYQNGVYLIRVYTQTAARLVFKPILDYECVNKGYSNLTLEASSDLPVKIESGYPEAVNVSSDFLKMMVPEGTLTEGVVEKSVRWDLGSTLDNDFEYGALEVYGICKDSAGNSHTILLTTLGGNAKSYLQDKTKDQTYTYSTEMISVKYNKSKYGYAQIRIWNTSGAMDFVFKMNYTNFSTGETAAANKASFDDTQTVNIDGIHSTWTVDYKLKDTVIDASGNTVTFNGKYLNGVNAPDSNGYYGNLRLVITEKPGYEIEGISLVDTENSSNIYTFDTTDKTSATYSGGMGVAYFSFNNGKYYVRLAQMNIRSMTVCMTYRALSGTQPYTVAMNGIAKGNTSLSVTGDDIAGVSVSSNLKRLEVANADTLTDGVDGKSFRWAFSSTYGSDWEYYKIEVYSAETGRRYGTMGANLESYLVNADKDQTVGMVLPGLTVKYNKSKTGLAYLRVWNISKNYNLVLYYKNYTTGEVIAADQATVNVNYVGKVSYNDSSVRLEVENGGSTTVNVNKKLEKEDGVKYFVYTKKYGDNVESINITANGRKYVIGEGFYAGQSKGIDVLGGKILYHKSTDGYAQIRIWNVVGNISLSTNLSHDNRYSIYFDEGEHGVFNVREMPASATYNNNMSKITVLQGSVYDSKAGNGTSVRYDVTPDVGWEIDCLKVTVNGQTYTLDHRELESGKTLTVKVLPNTAIRYNVDTKGAQIRMVHVDADTHIQVLYRQDEYNVTVYTQYKGVIKAEAYEDSGLYTTFTDNFAVAKVKAGTTAGRVNGIKYWIKPKQEGDIITNAVVRNKFGDYIIMGDDFTEKQWQDYRIKGGVVRYYKGYDGIIELRIWGIYEDLEVICFYNDETPEPNMAIPDDVGTFDLGPYGDKGGYDDVIVEPMKTQEDAPVTKKSSRGWILVTVSSAAGLLVLGAVLFLLLKRKKEKEKQEEQEEA